MESEKQVLGYSALRKLGQGAFGEVLLGKNSDKLVAIKKISKEKVIKVNKLHEPFIQKQVLLKLNNEKNNFFIKIQGTHSDDQFVYLLLQFCEGGSLQSFIKKTESISIELIKKISVRILSILQSLHQKQLIHRDLKPSNILMTKDGFLKLSDFGTCFANDSFFQPQIAKQIKQIKNISEVKKDDKVRKLSEEDQTSTNSTQRRYTFVGTACYMAPQLLNQDKCGKQSDLWAFGCILYELLHKKSPFFDESQGMIWTKILNGQVKVYNGQQQKDINQSQRNLQNLIQKLLIKQNEKRLGYGPNGYQDIKQHSFFAGVDWDEQSKISIQQIKNFVQSQIIQVQLSLQKKKSQKQKVIFSGVVGKKMYFGNYKDRTMVLHSFPKLVYYDTDTGQKKGEIVLDKKTPIKSDGKYFQVTTDKKTYYFKSKQSNQWVQMMKLAILSAFY